MNKLREKMRRLVEQNENNDRLFERNKLIKRALAQDVDIWRVKNKPRFMKDGVATILRFSM